MFFVLHYPRPIGVDPSIYLTKPQFDTTYEIDGEIFDLPFSPEIIEFESEFLARQYIKENYSGEEKITLKD